MIRLLLRLLRITDFEPCASCATLIKQLEFANAEKKELTDTLLSVLRPKAYEAPAVELNPITQTAMMFSKRRAILEQKDRESAMIQRNSTSLGKPDDKLTKINSLEAELGIEKEAVN